MKIWYISAAVCLALATPAQAIPLLYTFAGDVNFSFQIDSSPSAFSQGSFTFRVTPTSLVFNGEPALSNVVFYLSEGGGGMSLVDAPEIFYFNSIGEQLFTGTLENPFMRTGSFPLSPFSGDAPGTGTLTVAEFRGGVVPEPESWAMLIAGFGLVGAVARRRRAKALA
jgi:hypothetical protein